MDFLESLKEKIQLEKMKNGRAIVFWYDPAEQESLESLQSALVNETILVRELTETNFFKLKYEIEIENQKHSYLLYSRFSRPSNEENYLLDILLYSTEFKADEVAVLAERLSVQDHVLRPFVELYPLFFRSQERKQKLQRIVPPGADPRQLEIALLAVLTNAPAASMELVTRNLLVAGLDKNANEHYKRIEKYFSTERTRELIQQYFGISTLNEENSLNTLLETILYQHFKRDSLFEIEVLSETYRSSLPNICALFIDDWIRATEKEVEILENYIKDAEHRFEIRYHLQDVSAELIDKVTTFPFIDILLIEKVIDELEHKISNLVQWQERIQNRLGSYWGKKGSIQSYYHVLHEAVKLTGYKTLIKQFDSTEEIYSFYSQKLYVIDQAYRGLMHVYTQMEQREFVDAIVLSLTNWYENVFLLRLSDETNRTIEENSLSKVPKQRYFFQNNIQPILEKETTRVYVIISDALRFEAGYQLTERLNQRVNGEAKVTPMLASLPSYTQLGMASLLPNRTLTTDENKVVYADHRATNGITNRTKVLQTANSDAIAYHLVDFMDWTRSEAEDNLKGKRLVYFYHDMIDATGDSRKSERETYEAVEKTIRSLELAVDRLSRLQAKRIFITSDHGFLYQSNRVEADAKVQVVDGKVYDGNRRFAVGHELTVPEGALKLNPGQSPLENAEVVIAKGLNRFMTGGGLQFTHGGAMPQEVVVPVIDYRRTDRASVVEVSVAMLDKVITNHRVPITFYQETSVSNEWLSRQLKMAFYRSGDRISNEVIMTFDKIGDNQQRNEKIVFTLVEKSYAMGEPCYLRLETVNDNKIEFYKEERFIIRMYDALY